MERGMSEERTVLRPQGPAGRPAPAHPTPHAADTLAVCLLDPAGTILARYELGADFTVGRAVDNAITVGSELVSRHHLAVVRQGGEWWARNLQSTNGVYLGQTLVTDAARLVLPTVVSLGTSGFRLAIERGGATVPLPGGGTGHARPQAPSPPPPPPPPPAPSPSAHGAPGEGAPHTVAERKLSTEQIKARLLSDAESADAGEYTRIVRSLIREDRTQRGRGYRKVIFVLGALFAVAAGFVYYQQQALSNARTLAIDMFYDIKTLEVSLSQADARLEESARLLEQTLEAATAQKLRIDQERMRAEQEKIVAEKRRLAQEMERLKGMKAKYQQYVKEANALRLSFPTAARYEEELISRVARSFGESELELPGDFVAEVNRYIKTWQGSSRLQRAVENIEKNDYAPTVVSALKNEGLAPHFLYLPIQESNYDAQAIGPETRFGIAKGAWQLLAATAQDYGLAPGPLAAAREFDPQDPRFDFPAATQAAVKHLRHIYSTEAQASGLLVLASYNFGQTRVRSMIRELPDNPRERNFWKFIQKFELPKETYDYVFYIFSAAVIGEDPQHFGFKFRPPLVTH
jgi:soluble lytic murein transglycosylase-like protein